MYRGIKLDVRVRDYESALAALKERGRRARRLTEDEVARPNGASAPLGHPRSEVTGVRMGADEEIRFRLYSTDVVVWWPDNSVEIENYGTVTTTAFAHALLPHGFWLASRREELIFFNGLACAGPVVRFEHKDGHWWPDEDTLTTLRYPQLDRKAAREVRREHHLKDFEEWVTVGSAHFRIEHDTYNLSRCADALRERDFRTAAAHMPAVDLYSRTYRGFGIRDRARPLPVVCWGRGVVVLPSSFQHLALALYDREGAFDTIERKVLSCEEFERLERKARQVDKWASSGWGL